MKGFTQEKTRFEDIVLRVKLFQHLGTIWRNDRILRVVMFWGLFLNNLLHCQAVGGTQGGSTLLGEW